MNKEKQRQRLTNCMSIVYRYRKNAYSTLITFSFHVPLLMPFSLHYLQHYVYVSTRGILIFYDNFLLIPNDIFVARFFFLFSFGLKSICLLMFLCHVMLIFCMQIFPFIFKGSFLFYCWFIFLYRSSHLKLAIFNKNNIGRKNRIFDIHILKEYYSD